MQRKQEELQKIIINQQDELRRVSEQLVIARYGGVPERSGTHTIPRNNRLPTVIPIRELPANIYHHHQANQLQQLSQDYRKISSSPSTLHEAMHIDQDLIQQPQQQQPLDHYPSNLLDITIDQHMQNTSTSANTSLENDNESVSYMQLQPVQLMQSDSSSTTSQSQHQPHAHAHQHYVHFLSRQHPEQHLNSARYTSEQSSTAKEEDNKRQQETSPYGLNEGNATQEQRQT